MPIHLNYRGKHQTHTIFFTICDSVCLKTKANLAQSKLEGPADRSLNEEYDSSHGCAILRLTENLSNFIVHFRAFILSLIVM